MGASEGALDEPGLVVVWADPGITTGWCVLRVPMARLVSVGQVAVTPWLWWRIGQYWAPDTSASVDSYLALCRAAWERAGEEDVVVIGYEGFRLMMNSTDEALLEPERFGAVLRDRLRGTGVVPEKQYPGERSVITDARLKLWGLWKPGVGHGTDAQRHALVFLRRFASQEPLRRRFGYTG